MAKAPPRPKMFPPPEFPPRRLPLFARMPPAVFPAILGLLGLGLAMRRGLGALSLPVELAEVLLGGLVALWLFAAVAYGVKLARRPLVILDDLRTLPGRGGLATATMGMMAVAAVLVPYGPDLARGVLAVAIVLHGLLALLLIRVLLTGPPEQRVVTPVWHLGYVGFIVAGLAAPALGWPELAAGLIWVTGAVAVGIWSVSALQLIRRIPPAPLRPLLAIHLAPASLLGLVALNLGWMPVAQAFALIGAAILIALVLAGRWITESGFSALWAAFTFPLAAYASLLCGLDGPWLVPGVVLLIAAIGLIPWVGFRVLKSWADGSLATRTNAATA